MPQTTLSQNLTNLRLSNHLSQDEIIRISGKSWVSWCKYEKGEAKPPKTVLQRLSQYFQISVEEIVGDTPLPKRKSPTRKSEKQEPQAAQAGAKKAAKKTNAEEKTSPRKATSQEKEEPLANPQEETEEKVSYAEIEEEKELAFQAMEEEAALAEEEGEYPMELFIQSSDGREISLQVLYETLRREAPNAENVYVKPEENRAYWTAPRGQKGVIQLF